MWASITAFIGSLPELVSLARELVDGIKQLVDEAKRQRQEKWISDNRQVFYSLKRAQSDAERWVALRAITKLINDFPE